jgi:hypothetical protein
MMQAYGSWKQAGPVATLRAPGWENERDQVVRWQQILTSPQPVSRVVEFSTGSFWSGYFTYRLLNPGQYWVVAKFKRGKTKSWVDCSVRELSAVHFTQLPMGEINVIIGKKTLRAAKLTGQISPLAQVASPTTVA